MRQIVATVLTIFSSLSIAISGLVFSPANAVDSVVIENCATGTYKVTTVGSDVTVTDGSTCTGDVVIPAGVTSLGNSAFTLNNSLTSITIPSSVISISAYALYATNSLTNITVENGNVNFSSLNGVLFNSDYTTLLQYPPGKVAQSYFVPNSVISIGNFAFYPLKSLDSVIVPRSVEFIGQYALSSQRLSVYFLGPAPISVDDQAFASSGKGYVKTGATGFDLDVATNKWKNIDIAVGVFSVTFDSQGGTATTPGEFISDGSVQVPDAPQRSGYTFSGWSSTDGGSVETFPYSPGVTKDITLYANWTVNPPPALKPDGTYPCGSGTYTITSNVVSAGSSCTGALAIPEGITSIKGAAFLEASGLTAITIPASVTRIGSLAFVNNAALTAITVDAGNSEYTSANGVLFDKISTTLLAYPAGKPTSTFLIPASVRTIADFAFAGAYSLTSLTVEAGNANYAAADGVLFDILSQTLIAYPSGKVTSPYLIPASVTSIGVGAFAGAAKLNSITIPVGVASIGYAAFYSASTLTSVTIPVGVTFIESSVFEQATSLTSITIPAGVTYIDSFAFANATALATVTIPASVSYIGTGAFEGASSLKSIYFLGNAPASDPVGLSPFTNIGSSAKALIKSSATGFALDGTGKWNGLTVESVDSPAVSPPSIDPPADNSPSVDLITQVAAEDLAARTLKVRSRISGKALASRVGVKMVSPKAKVTFSVSKASKQICVKSGSSLKTLKAGNCVVTFTVQEPTPKKAKKPKATKTVKTLVVQ